MEGKCREWEFCMNRNPKVVGNARVGAEIVAEAVNGFVEVISWRTMVSLPAFVNFDPAVLCLFDCIAHNGVANYVHKCFSSSS